MKFLGNINLARTAISLFAIGVMLFGVLSIAVMEHRMGMVENCPVISQVNGCSGSHQGETCVSYHLGIMQSLSSASCSSLDIRMLSLLFTYFIGLVIFSLFKIFEYSYLRHRIRLKQLYEKTIFAFTLQLGYWLTLLEKRDPAYAFALT